MLETERLKCTFVSFQLWNIWFQHDGAPAHKTSSVKQYLVEESGEQIIGYGGFQDWPPLSTDLTPIDFLLWGYLKQQVYATLPPTLQDHQRRITDACANVTPAMLYHVQHEVQARVRMCIVADGEKFEHRK
ncbi:hypothetical protein AVEN_56079-1 [Araneus ventricosus]|uniref:Tc1-like transposase DDE domain-containing protein n=1 Tax=Araneus ventricosus TaxID=182803 RepID=A0A4Y2TYZ9_ARAVE|nr:hypothetical protein AVEN_103306-1 [Araneus ventricosus]GBO05939.1 hypothetical protein AVEN_103450-1 [Araneus ventricosus]GBO05941.1 hypothetical protein AVEN_45547-1 [Araneus ventricosus]GBO05942.1 hypothetical protein AVEN_56079-1 [Araneus ventricosus]